MRRGFTLIELLIVVAIIAILAAIAVPNFLEAQVRSKVSRAKADMRSLVTAIESYRVDHNHYIPDGQTTPKPVWYGVTQDTAHLSNMLTTPVSYITNVSIADPFNTDKVNPWDRKYRWINFEDTYAKSTIQARIDAYARAYGRIYGAYMLLSNGPDKRASITDPDYNYYWVVSKYDATNGTISPGDIILSQKGMDPAYPAPPL